jgi:hypothetical protein
MRGNIIMVRRYRRRDLQADKSSLFVFGDNMAGTGLGGQAAACRGEPNAVGIPTKWRPGMNERDFFTDADLEQVGPTLAERFARLMEHLHDGGHVIWPADGIGTGLAQLEQRAPSIRAYIMQSERYLVGKAGKVLRCDTPRGPVLVVEQNG